MPTTARRSLAVVFCFSVVSLSGCSGEIDYGAGSDRTEDAFSLIQKHPHKRVCDDPGAGLFACHARIRVADDGSGIVPYATSPTGGGLVPSDLQAAYKIDPSLGSGKTVAIVDAYDNPNAEKDMGVYRAQFGLPACTTANGCFKKVNQNGVQGSYPSANSGWAGEIALDLDMVSAACPNCKIILVEVNSPTDQNLGTGVNSAVSLGATTVSNSYGGGEDSSVTSIDSFYHHPGVGIFASSGDNGYGVEYPAASQYVIAVGGTALTKSTSTARGWVEQAWNSAGSGCSGFEPKPSWQKDSGCSKRTVADVSAVADPNTGVSVYDTYGGNGWAVYGGTSAASPLVAAMFALAGKGSSDASIAYNNTTAFFDVTSGSNGSCGGSYLCTGKAGYDGPTGNGTPNTAVLAGQSGGTTGGGTTGGGTTGGGTTGGGTTGGGTTGGGTTGGGTTGGGGTCSHPICSQGTKLTSSCDPCAATVCAKDSYCCTTAWDGQCVSEVTSFCGKSCGGGGSTTTSGGGGGTCSHPICSTGGKLTSSCSSCASTICSQDPYCCTTAWDSICVGEVGSICGQSC